MNHFPSQQTVEGIRDTYKAGTVVVLDHMTDTQAPPTGTFGVVECVDDIGTVFVRWSTGSGLGVAYGEDSIHAASAYEAALYKIQCEAKEQHDGSRCPRCGEVMPGGLHTHALSRRAEIIVCDKCGREEAIEDAAQAGIFKNSKPPMQIEDWYVCTQCGGGILTCQMNTRKRKDFTSSQRKSWMMTIMYRDIPSAYRNTRKLPLSA
ncbi:MAG: DUF4314 domain-containing protein [Prevotellaceae bacterium]|nr:DUF4314 domain-containing protein [Prevotellaceae bacterium]